MVLHSHPGLPLDTPPHTCSTRLPCAAQRGKQEQFPINRLFFVGRNYHAHAVEMGKPVDKSVERPFYFTKSPGTLVLSGATVAYPPETKNYHFEMELVLAIGAGFPRLAGRRPRTGHLRLRLRPGHDPA
jgi:2-keto-4-pentenoate hydratase/2-oxohepta-3-ene-1,7-dioic acid hydratase in catechol pathway